MTRVFRDRAIEGRIDHVKQEHLRDVAGPADVSDRHVRGLSLAIVNRSESCREVHRHDSSLSSGQRCGTVRSGQRYAALASAVRVSGLDMPAFSL